MKIRVPYIEKDFELTFQGENLRLRGARVTQEECVAFLSDFKPGAVVNLRGDEIGHWKQLPTNAKPGGRLPMRLRVNIGGCHYEGRTNGIVFKGKRKEQ